MIPKSFHWSHFNQNDLKVSASDTISTSEIRKLYLETFGITDPNDLQVISSRGILSSTFEGEQLANLTYMLMQIRSGRNRHIGMRDWFNRFTGNRIRVL